MQERPTTIKIFSDFSITLMLADSVQAVQGKLYLLGGGWNLRPPQPMPCAIGAIVAVPWSETNRPHSLEFVLIDGNGQPFLVPTENGPQPLSIRSQFEVGRNAGLPPGIRINVPIAINIGPLPLPTGQFEWRVTLDGKRRDDWRLPFTVLDQAPS